MHGIELDLFKEPITTKNRRENQEEEMQECEPDHIVWMHYDFIKIKEISDFERYFISDSDEVIIDNKHEGDMQSMHLYFFPRNNTEDKEPKLKIYKEQKKEGKIFYGEAKAYAFACIATFKLSQRSDDEKSMEEIVVPNPFRQKLNRVTAVFDRKLNGYKNDYEYDWYGSLGTEELVLLINADSIKIFTDILEIIRLDQETSECLSSTYSFVFSNFNEIKSDCVQVLDTRANISLTLNPSGNVDKYVESIKRKIFASFEDTSGVVPLEEVDTRLKDAGIGFYNMIGKYDYFISVPEMTWNFLEEFNEGGLFHSNTPIYQENVFQIKTNWLYNEGETTCIRNGSINSANNQDSKIDSYISESGQRIREIKESPPEYLKNAKHILRAIDLLYYDFKKNLRSVFAVEWSEDLHCQFNAFLDLFKNSADDIETQYNIIEESINSIRQTYIHITQASRMFFEIPATNLRYTGSFNKILRAYYGIVKQLLYMAYSIKRTSRQSKLIPIITFEYTAKVNTHIYIQNKNLEADRLVVFHLPYEALSNLPKYTEYLCHEVFHYIAPSKRSERNKLLTDISIYYYHCNFLQKILCDYLHKKENGLIDPILNSLVKRYIEVNSTIIKKFIEIIYSNTIASGQKESTALFGWFHDQSLKFFLESLKKTYFMTEGRNRSQLIYFFHDFMKLWIKEARTFSEEEAEQFVLEMYQECQIQPKFQSERIVQLFDLRKVSLDELLAKSDLEMERLDSIIVEDSVKRSEMLAYGMMEAKCDYFTLQIMRFDLQAYLNFQFRFLYEYGVLENLLDQTGNEEMTESSYLVRIGIICNYYADQMGERDTERFCRRIKECEYLVPSGDSERERFGKYLEYVSLSYERYLKLFHFYANGILENLLTETMNRDTIVETQINNITAAKDEMYIYCHEYAQKNQSERFRINITMMERFQRQLSMDDLDRVLNKSYLDHKEPEKDYTASVLSNISEETVKYTMEISDFSEYIRTINTVSSFLRPRDQSGEQGANVLWYRGQPNKDYYLLPGLFREWKRESNISPLEYEAALMDMFSSRTSHTMETDLHLMRNPFDWIAHMQHYGMPTNLLDWSENAYVALFFALVENEDKITENDAAVYVMNPEYMELAREAMIKSTNLNELQKRTYPIVNLSTEYFDKSYGDFLPFRSDFEFNLRASRWWDDNTGKSETWWARPVISSLSNVRIRAQYGAFTIFNLMAKPNYSAADGGYDYLSIENMQKEFLNKYRSEYPFLFKIVIKQASAKEIVRDLKNAGFRTMNVYPEIENISKAIKKQIGRYFEI